MGITLNKVLFFDTNIRIRPHTASDAFKDWIGKTISIGEFSRGRQMRLYLIEGTDEYLFELLDGEFVQGPEANNE